MLKYHSKKTKLCVTGWSIRTESTNIDSQPLRTPPSARYSSHALTETGPARSGLLPSWIGAGVTVSPIPQQSRCAR
jgi:hypothetical protein